NLLCLIEVGLCLCGRILWHQVLAVDLALDSLYGFRMFANMIVAKTCLRDWICTMLSYFL
ncbi:hypothetical protein, partial [Helicobacter sp. T3_23-1059]